MPAMTLEEKYAALLDDVRSLASCFRSLQLQAFSREAPAYEDAYEMTSEVLTAAQKRETPMRNIGKAIEVLNRVDEEDEFLPDNAAYAHALEAAGLLMPDLPEPEIEHRKHCDRLWGEIEVGEDAGERKVRLLLHNFLLTTDEAREYAYRLLAAADYAEKEQDND